MYLFNNTLFVETSNGQSLPIEVLSEQDLFNMEHSLFFPEGIPPEYLSEED